MVIPKIFPPSILLISLLAALVFSLPNAVALNLGTLSLARVALQEDVAAADSAKHWLEFGMLSAASFRNLSRLYFAQGYAAQAIEAGKQAVALAPNDPLAAYWLGQAYWEVGNKDTARQVWRASGVIQGKLDRLVWLCWANVGQGDLDAAEVALREAIDLDPEWGPAYDALASLQWGRDWEKVSLALEHAIANLPEGTAQWYWNDGRRHLLNGNWQDAAQALRAAADLQPPEWTLRFLVDALQRSGDLDEAAEAQVELEELLEK